MLSSVVNTIFDILNTQVIVGVSNGTVAAIFYDTAAILTVLYTTSNLYKSIRDLRRLIRFKWNGLRRMVARHEIVIQLSVLFMSCGILTFGLLATFTGRGPHGNPPTKSTIMYVYTFVLLASNFFMFLIAYVSHRLRSKINAYHGVQTEFKDL